MLQHLKLTEYRLKLPEYNFNLPEYKFMVAIFFSRQYLCFTVRQSVILNLAQAKTAKSSLT